MIKLGIIFLLSLAIVTSLVSANGFGYNNNNLPSILEPISIVGTGGGNFTTINNYYNNTYNVTNNISTPNDGITLDIANITNFEFNYNQSSSFYSWLSSFIFNYNQSDGSYNITYQNFAYNMSEGSYNISYQDFSYNQTEPANIYTNLVNNSLASWITNTFLSLTDWATGSNNLQDNITLVQTNLNTNITALNASTILYVQALASYDIVQDTILSNNLQDNITRLDNIQFQRLQRNSVTRNHTAWNVTIFQWNLTANSNYSYDCLLNVGAIVGTTGVQFNLTLSQLPNWWFNNINHPTTAAAAVVLLQDAGANKSSSDLSITSLVYPLTLPVTFNGFIENGASANQFNISMKSEVAASNVTVERGSYCKLQER